MEEVLNYEGLIYGIISKYPKRYDRDDLYQVGMLGLIDAYKHFNKNYETKFSTFAYYYIVGEVNKYIRESSSLKVSKDLIELKKKILKVKEVMIQKLGREPSNLEISLYLEVDEELVNEALIATDEVTSMDEIYNIGNYDNTSADILDLKLELEKLPEEEKNIILARYYDDMTQSEVSKKLGISQVQVSRNENKILQKLRSNL